MKILKVDKDKVQVELTKEEVASLGVGCCKGWMHLQSEAVQSDREGNIMLTKVAQKVKILNGEFESLEEQMKK